MRSNAYLLAIGAGLISAVVFASATTGPLPMRGVLFFLTPLALYLTGLGLGVTPVALAATVATASVLLMAGPLAATAYAISTSLPALYLTRLALLGRMEGDEQVWYPLGAVVVWAAIFAGLFSVFALHLMGGDMDALHKLMRGVVETFVKDDLNQIPGAPKIEAAQIDDITRSTVLSLPWALAILSLTNILLNLWLAGRITLASGRLVRPWPDLAMLTLPPGTSFGIAVAIGLSFLGGFHGLLASALAAPLVASFALVGLAVAHWATRGSPWRNFILAALYIGVFFVGQVVLPALVIAGLAETIFHYRTAQRPPPGTPT